LYSGEKREGTKRGRGQSSFRVLEAGGGLRNLSPTAEGGKSKLAQMGKNKMKGRYY